MKALILVLAAMPCKSEQAGRGNPLAKRDAAVAAHDANQKQKRSIRI